MAETLKLEAAVVDRFSKPLQDLRKQLQEVKPPPTLKQMGQDFERVKSQVAMASREIGTGFNTALSGLGIASLGAAASIAGITAAVRKFSTSTIEMKQFQRETGVTIETLKQLKSASGSFGANEDAIAPAIKNFASRMYDIRRGIDPAIGELVTAQETALVRKLRDGKTTMSEALNEVLDTAARSAEQGPAGAERGKRILNALGLGELTPFILRGRGALEELRKTKVSPINDDDEKKAIAFAEAMEKADKAVQSISKTIAIHAAPLLTMVADKLEGSIKSINDLIAKIENSPIGRFLLDADKGAGEGMAKFNRSLGSLPGAAGVGPGAAAGMRRAQITKEIGVIDSSIDRTYANPDDPKAAALREELTKRRDELLREQRDLTRKIEEGSAKGTEKGAKDGVTAAIEKMSLLRNPLGDGEARIMRASYGGGGFSRGAGAGNVPVPRFGGGGGGRFNGLGLGETGRGTPLAPDGRGSVPYPFPKSDSFDNKAGEIVRRLMKDDGLTREQAAGIVGNLGHESGGFRHYQEGGKAFGTGGAGWAQWTGPRRRAFEAWAKAQGLDPRSDEANYGYLRADPEYAKALAAVRRQRTVAGAMTAFEQSYERAGIKAYGSRMGFANRAYEAGGLLNAGREAGVVGSKNEPNNGRIDLSITGLPHGWKSRAEGSGLFRDVQVQRGRSRVVAGEDI